MKHEHKVAIIENYSLRYSPFVSFYAKLFEENGIDYIILNKEDKEFAESERHHIFRQDENVGSISKLRRTLDWYKFIWKELKSNNVEKIVVTPTRTAIVLFPLLLFKRGKFVFDIRDYTKEGSVIYRVIEKILLSLASLVVISSNGFMKWLPKTKTQVTTIHNMPLKALPMDFRMESDGQRIVIAYIGMLGYFSINKALVDALANDETYGLQYSGGGDIHIQEYVNENDIKNVAFTGPFSNEEKRQLYENVDMINAIYGNDSLVVTTALPNKLYDAIIYHKPIIASAGTYLGELVEKNKIGFAVDIKNDNIKEKLDSFWCSFDETAFVSNCDRMLEMVTNEQSNTIKAILAFCGH